MRIVYCCPQAKTTAFTRYGRRITVTSSQELWLPEIGRCISDSKTAVPDLTAVPTKESRRRFAENTLGPGLQKMYLCPAHLQAYSRHVQFFKTKTEAITHLVAAALLTY